VLDPVSIVIPSWNGRRLLEEFLPSVIEAAVRYLAAAGAEAEVVIVDDGSTDGTATWVTDRASGWPVPVRCVSNEGNLGFGAACNRGLQEAAFPLVLLLNNDVEVQADAIAPLAARFRDEGDQLFAVHCRVLDFDTHAEVGTGKMGGFARGFLRVHRSYVVREQRQGPLYSMFASGGSAMFRRARFLELGGFDQLFAPFYLEDVELSYRAWKRGLTVGYEPASVVRHRFSSTIGGIQGANVPAVAQRNRLILHWIHLDDGRLVAWHALWTLVLLVTSPLTLKPQFVRGFFSAVARLPAIRARRREGRGRASRSDRDVLEVFASLGRRPDIRAYDDPRELDGTRDEFVEKKRPA
jgi:GT2 family glycosyltransferase